MTLLPRQHWAYSFSIDANEIDNITNLLLDKETPLSSAELATEIIRQRELDLQRELERQYKGTKLYQPSGRFEVGDRLIFSTMEFRTATVVDVRDGRGNGEGCFKVATVEFDARNASGAKKQRQFATAYDGAHPLNELDAADHPRSAVRDYDLEDILNDPNVTIIEQVNDALEKNPDLVRLAGSWFVRELMLDVNIGHLHLAEAVLDMNNGGPVAPREILREIGGLGDAPIPLQVFSLNHAMNQDDRFDEVGPAGQVLWNLRRLLPRMVRQVPKILQYVPEPYDRSSLRNEMLQLEYDLDDEHSPLKSAPPEDEISLTLIYPHRRVGTLPINSETRHLFPGAKTARIAITIVDALDKEEYPCWVVHEFRYVFGLSALYQKHHLPVGAYVYLNGTDDPSRIEIEFDNYRPRTEWIPLVERTENDQLRFRSAKRAIGADFDDMIIVGVHNLVEVDKLGQEIQNRKVPIAHLLRNLVMELSKHNPQKTVHGKVLYSNLNILRRCPPGPVFATLLSHPDFEYVGGNYWKLSD